MRKRFCDDFKNINPQTLFDRFILAFQWNPQIDPSRAVEDNQARRRLHLRWRLNFRVERSARRLSRAARSKGGVFRGTLVSLNVFFWFIFCDATENEHPS